MRKKSLLAPKQSQLLGLDQLILNQYFINQNENIAKDILKKKQEQESLILTQARLSITKSQYKKCFFYLANFANKKTTLTTITQLQVFQMYTYSAFKIIQKFLINKKTNVQQLEQLLIHTHLAITKWHHFMQEIVLNSGTQQFLQELTGLILMAKIHQINRIFFTTKNQSSEVKKKQTQLLRELELFQAHFTILMKTPSKIDEPIKNNIDQISQNHVQRFISKQLSKFLGAFIKYSHLSFLSNQRIYCLLVQNSNGTEKAVKNCQKQFQKVFLGFYQMGIKDINRHFLQSSTKQVSILKYLSESTILEASFLLVTMGDFQQAHLKYYEAMGHAFKGMQGILYEIEGHQLNDIKISQIFSFNGCFRNLLISLGMICYLAEIQQDLQELNRTVIFMEWLESNITCYIKSQYQQLRMTNQIVNVQYHLLDLGTQLKSKYSDYLAESSEINKTVRIIWCEVEAINSVDESTTKQKTLVEEFNEKLYKKLNIGKINDSQFIQSKSVHVQLTAKKTHLQNSKFNARINSSMTGSSFVMTTNASYLESSNNHKSHQFKGSQKMLNSLKGQSKITNSFIIKEDSVLDETKNQSIKNQKMEKILETKTQSSRKGTSELQDEERFNLEQQYKFIGQKKQKILQIKKDKKEKEDQQKKLQNQYAKDLDDNALFDLSDKMDQVLEKQIQESLVNKRINHQLRTYNDVFDDFIYKMNEEKQDQKKLKSEKHLLSFFNKFGRGIYSEEEKQFNKIMEKIQIEDDMRMNENQNVITFALNGLKNQRKEKMIQSSRALRQQVPKGQNILAEFLRADTSEKQSQLKPQGNFFLPPDAKVSPNNSQIVAKELLKSLISRTENDEREIDISIKRLSTSLHRKYKVNKNFSVAQTTSKSDLAKSTGKFSVKPPVQRRRLTLSEVTRLLEKEID